MTKTLKGQSARSFTTSSTEEFINARGLFLTQPVRLDSGPVVQATLASDTALANDISVALVVGKPIGAFNPCPVDMDSVKAYAIAHGNLAMPASEVIFVPPEIADEGTLNVVVGGSVSGNIDFAGDHDSVTVFLISGQVYLISLRGTGATPINDSYLEIFNPSNVSLGHDDDGGNNLYSIFTFTAAATGNFRIDVSSFPNVGDPGLGGYTVDVRVRGVDAVGNTNATSVHLDQGTTFGFRETGSGSSGVADVPSPTFSGDLDRYSVDLVAGHFYTFKYAGGSDYETGYYEPQSATNMDTYLLLRNTAGTILAQNDDVGFPDDLSSGIGFYATVTGTYYLDAFAYGGYAAGYAIEFKEVDLAGLDPTDAINWFSADNIDTVDVSGTPTAYVYFAVAGEGFGEKADNGVDPIPSHGWSAYEKAAVMSALQEFSKILGINYVETSDSSLAEFRLITTTSANYGAYFYPQDPGYGTQQGIGAFNIVNRGWNEGGPSADPAVTTDGLQKGGFAYSVIIHEFGHAHGLAHPHDTGGGSDVMPGVTAAQGSYGVFDLNQMVYTQMSYNDGWVTHPDGAIVGGDPAGFRSDAGWSATLSAFDIATLQLRYGILNPTATGDTVYTLKDVNNEGTWYECIWDTGGTDTIEYTGATRGAVIDLTAATIDYTPTGGGVMSFVHNLPGETTAQAIKGGFTIAKGVVIENATGGGGNDNLVGNSAANVLTGNGGNDNFIGRGGNDTIHGGAGTDTAFYVGVKADYTITAIVTAGVVTGFTVTDNNIVAPPTPISSPIEVPNEATDTLDGVETLTFSDTSISLAGGVLVYDASDSLVAVYTTIQAAIDNATTLDGYTVFVSSGTYAEDVTVTKDLTIEGANAGTAGTAGGRIAESIIKSITVTHAGVTVDGVEVTGDKLDAGFYIGVNVKGSDFILTNSVLSGRDGDFVDDTVAVMLNGSLTGLDVGHNLITGYLRGVYIVSGTTEGDVHDNLFQGAGSGGWFDGMGNGINTESQLVIIQDNTFDGIWAGVVNVGVLGSNPADLLTFIIDNFYTNNNGDRPIQVYPTNDVHELYGTNENEAFSGDLAVTDYGVTNASFTFHGRGGADHIYGHTMGDFLYGDDGNDLIYASGGDDHVKGGAGNDGLYGDSGIDTALFDQTTGFTLYLDTAVGWALISDDGTDFASDIEILEDGAGQRDLLVGGTGFDTIQAAFDEAVTGDHVRLANATWIAVANYSVDGLIVYGQPGSTQTVTYSTLTAFGIHVYGAGNADYIATGDGNDFVDGGAGADLLSGGGGNDFLIVDNVGDGINEAIGGGYDNVASSVSYTLESGAYVEVLSTTNNDGLAAINLIGNELDNIVVGNAASNYLDGGIGGADRLAGRGGDDALIVDTGDVVDELAGGGYDNVAARSHYQLTFGAYVEVLSTTNNAGTDAINLTGNEFDNVIVGNAGSNVLDGSFGHDRLAGLGGTDSYQFSTFLSSFNWDTIDGYDADDVMLLDHNVFTGLSAGALAAGAFATGAAATEADDRIIYDTATGALYFDQDGVGGVDQIQFALMLGGPSLNATDFTVI